MEAIGEQIRWLFSGAGVVIGAFMYGLVKYYFVDRNRSENTVEIFVGPERDKNYNSKFYEYFRKVISSSKENIYITGEGFSCADAEGQSLARDFHTGMQAALARGVHVVRIQTRGNASQMWAEMLSELLQEFPDKFHLYLLRENKISQISSTCVIDPESSRNVVEVMLSTARTIGLKLTDIARTAIFIHGKKTLAKDLVERIMMLTSEDISFRITDPKQVLPMMTTKKEYYFSYGSNMSQRQMSDRVKNAEMTGVAYLENYKLVFNRKGSYRPGGVASVEASDGNRVYGTIWKMPMTQLIEMDEHEDPKAYVRETKTVIGLDGEEKDCYLYLSIPQGSIEPDPHYLELIISSANEAGLPTEYMEYLESFRS